MAKIDVSTIEGYENMTTEEKLAALENLNLPEENHKGYVKKDVFDKTASELAGYKKQLREKLSEEEQNRLEQEEKFTDLESKYNKLLEESTVSKFKSKFLAQGYDETLAEDTANAMLKGDYDKIFENQQKHLEAVEKKIKADLMKETKKPEGGQGGKEVTLDTFRKMSTQERFKYSQEHPDEYKALYEEGEKT